MLFRSKEAPVRPTPVTSKAVSVYGLNLNTSFVLLKIPLAKIGKVSKFKITVIVKIDFFIFSLIIIVKVLIVRHGKS